MYTNSPARTLQLNNSLLDLLVANLARLDESEDSDSRGIFNILGVFENLLSFMSPLADQIVAETTLMPWLLKRVAAKEYDSNKQYASQVLAILLQQSRENVMKLAELEGMDTILNVLSVSIATCHVSLALMLCSNTGRKIQPMGRKSSLWKTCSIVCAQHLQSQR